MMMVMVMMTIIKFKKIPALIPQIPNHWGSDLRPPEKEGGKGTGYEGRIEKGQEGSRRGGGEKRKEGTDFASTLTKSWIPHCA